CRAFERAHGLVVIEPVDQRQALIEKLLRFGARRRDRMVQPAHAGHQRRGPGGGRRVSIVLLRVSDRQREQQKNEHHSSSWLLAPGPWPLAPSPQALFISRATLSETQARAPSRTRSPRSSGASARLLRTRSG